MSTSLDHRESNLTARAQEVIVTVHGKGSRVLVKVRALGGDLWCLLQIFMLQTHEGFLLHTHTQGVEEG